MFKSTMKRLLENMLIEYGFAEPKPIQQIATEYIATMKQYTREERDRKIADINRLCADGSLTLTSIQNVVRMFVKQEVLASERMVDRPICAREVLLRDLSHCILHYTQD